MISNRGTSPHVARSQPLAANLRTGQPGNDPKGRLGNWLDNFSTPRARPEPPIYTGANYWPRV